MTAPAHLAAPAPSVARAVPIIDLAPFFQGSQDGRTKVARQVRDACEQIGFAWGDAIRSLNLPLN